MTWNDDAGQWDHEDPPEPDYETFERDQIASEHEDDCSSGLGGPCDCPLAEDGGATKWHDDDPGPDEETDDA